MRKRLSIPWFHRGRTNNPQNSFFPISTSNLTQMPFQVTKQDNFTETSPFENYYIMKNEGENEKLKMEKISHQHLRNYEEDVNGNEENQDQSNTKNIPKNVFQSTMKNQHKKNRSNSAFTLGVLVQNLKFNSSKEKQTKKKKEKMIKNSKETNKKVPKENCVKKREEKKRIISKSIERKSQCENRSRSIVKKVHSLSQHKKISQKSMHKEQKTIILKKKKEKVKKQKQKKKKNFIHLSEEIAYLQKISKICGIISAYREAYQLASYYFRSAFRKISDEKQKEILVYSSIFLALKVTDSSMGKKFLREVVTHDQPYQIRHKKSFSIESLLVNPKQQIFLEKFEEKMRTQHRMQKYLTKIKNYQQKSGTYQPKRCQLIEMEVVICKQLNFRLMRQTYASVIDKTTFVWDSFILEEQKKEENLLLFRAPSETRKFSYLLQTIQLLLVRYFYRKNTLLMVLTTMYLLIRISLQVKPKFFNERIKQIKQCQNFIFIDKHGVNLMFIKFIQKMGVEFQQISEYLQFIIPFCYNENFKNFSYSFADAQTHNDSLSIHQNNDNLFKI